MSSKRDRILFFSSVLEKLCEETGLDFYFRDYDFNHYSEVSDLKSLPKVLLNSGNLVVAFPNKTWTISAKEANMDCTESEITEWFYAKLIQSSF